MIKGALDVLDAYAKDGDLYVLINYGSEVIGAQLVTTSIVIEYGDGGGMWNQSYHELHHFFWGELKFRMVRFAIRDCASWRDDIPPKTQLSPPTPQLEPPR